MRKRTFLGTVAVVAIISASAGYFFAPVLQKAAFKHDIGIWFCHNNFGAIKLKNGDTIECAFGRKFDAADYDTPERNSKEGSCATNLAKKATEHLGKILADASKNGKSITVVANSEDRSFKKFGGIIEIDGVSVAEEMTSQRPSSACKTKRGYRVKQWCGLPDPCVASNMVKR